MTLDAILFDLDETLLVEYASVDATFLAVCELARDAYGVDPESLHRSVREAASALWQQAPARDYILSVGISSWEALWAGFGGEGADLAALRDWSPFYRREVWVTALRTSGITDVGLASTLSEALGRERHKRHVPYADAVPVLDDLGATYPLALVTNGLPELQRYKIAASGLEGYFHAMVISGEVGVGKPDPRVFACALEQLGVSADRTVMVGNSLHRDIGGAQAAGIRAVWLNRERAPRVGDIRPDAEIADLYALRRVLASAAG